MIHQRGVINDSTRMDYGLHAAKTQNIAGLFTLIDFEKALASLSWKFLCNVLEFFGYKIIQLNG